MTKRIITPPSLVRPRGFSHGILTSGGGILWLAGQDASDAEGQIVAPGDLAGQLDQALSNLHAVVAEAGGQMADIVQLTLYVRDRDAYLAQRHALGAVWKRHFGDYYPALALFQVTGFFQANALIELTGVAVIGAEEVGALP